MARIDINDLPVDQELTSGEAKDAVGGASYQVPGADGESASFFADAGGTYSLNYSDLTFTQKVNKASPKLFL